MSDMAEAKDEDWDEDEETPVEFVDAGPANVMQFSDFVEADEKKLQKLRITELRRRAEERQDWKRISSEYDWDFDLDDKIEEA